MKFGLSIDPSVHKTGLVAWIEEDGIWKPHNYKTLVATNFEAMIADLDDELRFPWDWVAVEDVYQGKNAQTNIMLAGMVYSIWTLCIPMGIPFMKLSTAEIDKACGTYADSEDGRKAVTLSFARRELGADIDQHQADAYCVGVAALGRIKAREWADAAEKEWAEEAARRAGRD